MVVRAKVILASAKGLSLGEICKMYSLDHQFVRRWVKRYIADGYDGLKEQKRTGRPTTIQPRVLQKIATLVVQLPEKFGLPLTRWSVRELSAFVHRRYGWTVSPASVSRFLRSMALKPHRVRYWLNPSDPDFDKKAARICKLYISPPAGTTVLSIDEKPGIQALRRIHPTRPLRPGKPTRVEFEYERKGTRNLFAAFNIKNGQVLVWSTPDRSIPWVLSFLDQLLRWVRRGPIVIITDNISTRTGNAAKQWLAKHPRVRFVFTPKHGSWLNQVEIWFSILTSKALRHRSFDSLRALDNALYRFARYWNNSLARPFEWTYTGKVLKA
jgi:transposase